MANRSLKIRDSKIDQCVQSAFSQGVRYIGVSTKCKKDVCKNLYSKGYNSETVSAAIALLISDGYINEVRYARRKIADILSLRPVSVAKIKKVLIDKGIDCNIIEGVLSGYNIDEIEIAGNILKERFGSIEEASVEQNAKKAEALLKYRGFTYGIIRKLVIKTGERYWNDI